MELGGNETRESVGGMLAPNPKGYGMYVPSLPTKVVGPRSVRHGSVGANSDLQPRGP
jgi:hypothetical protein